LQEKVVFDTNIYIGIFNRGLYRTEVDGFRRVMYLVHPVLHELWVGARGKKEVSHLIRFGNAFVRLSRLVQPHPATQILIGRICNKLRFSGMLNPGDPSAYNDVCIALLARQIGATVVTRDTDDFSRIRQVIDFRFRDVT
jgi:predicted nucleic acid-binding protein